MLLLLTAGLVGLTSCHKSEKKPLTVTDTVYVHSDYDGILPEGKLVFEDVVSTHRQQMFNLRGGGDYTWYESHAVLLRDLDDENQDGTVGNITSIFSVWSEESGINVQYVTTDWKRGTWIPGPVPGVWIEDCNMNEAEIVLTFEAAYQKLMEANVVKPHDKNVTLRIPVGPRGCNAQYVFGNMMEVVFVDAVTGEVRTKNPAFEGYSLKTPLGEWP